MEKGSRGSVSPDDVADWIATMKAVGVPTKDINRTIDKAVDPDNIGGQIAELMRQAGITSAEEIDKIFRGEK